MSDIDSTIDYKKIWIELYSEVTMLKSQAQIDVDTKDIGHAALTAYSKVISLMDEKVGLNILEAIPGFDKLLQGGCNDIRKDT